MVCLVCTIFSSGFFSSFFSSFLSPDLSFLSALSVFSEDFSPGFCGTAGAGSAKHIAIPAIKTQVNFGIAIPPNARTYPSKLRAPHPMQLSSQRQFVGAFDGRRFPAGSDEGTPRHKSYK